MSTCSLPTELLIQISSYLSWSELALWTLTNREHVKCISPVLYKRLEPFEYKPADLPGVRTKATRKPHQRLPPNFKGRCRILNWAAERGLVGTIEKVLDSEDGGECIDCPILKDGSGMLLGSFGMTPMHQAALHGHANVIEYLVQRGANVNATVAGHLRPIHFARKEAVVRALVRHGSPLHPKGVFSVSPLAHSISMGSDPSAVKCFIELGCDYNSHSQIGVSPLEAALRVGNVGVLEVLLNAGLDVSGATSREGPPIYKAIDLHQEKNPQITLMIVQLLLKHGAPAHGGKIIVDGPWDLHLLQSNLFLAITLPNSANLANLLLEHGAKVNEQSWIRKQAWPTSVERRRGEMPGPRQHERAWVGRRISYVVGPQTPIKSLILSAKGTSESQADAIIEVVAVLARHGAKVDGRMGEGNFISHLLTMRPLTPGLVKMAAYVAGLIANSDKLDKEPRYSMLKGPIGPIYPFLSNPEWFSSSGCASNTVTIGLFERLLDLGVDVHEPDTHGNSPLILACTLPSNPSATNGMKFIRALKARGADINAGSAEGRNPLHMMLRGGSPLSLETANRFQALLANPTGENDAEVCVNAPDRSGMTPLMTLARVNPDKEGYYGEIETPVEIRNRMMLMLIRSGANVRARYQPRENAVKGSCPGGTALHLACGAADTEGVRLLLNYGAKGDVNSVDDNGFTPLMMVMAKGALRNDIVLIKEYLLGAGADPGIKTPGGKTAWDIWTDRLYGPDWLRLAVWSEGRGRREV